MVGDLAAKPEREFLLAVAEGPSVAAELVVGGAEGVVQAEAVIGGVGGPG
jgi:hypothetical protein